MSRDGSNIYLMKKIKYTVTSEDKRERLDTFIAQKNSLTRSFIRKLLNRRLVLVNSRAEKASYRVQYCDRIEFTLPDEPEGVLIPENIPLDILFEDKHIVAVNKPAGMVIYPAAGNRKGTLMNALAAQCNKLSSIGAPLRPGVVHRLDKDTSGALVIAKDDLSYYGLVEQFKRREIEKQYLALLYGRLKTDRGEIKLLIGRSVSDRKKMSTRTRRGKEAITQYETVERLHSSTLAKIRILTGRTHQIRVHFASLGHPVLGDTTYGKKTSLQRGTMTIKFSRQMLHASRLKIKHPVTGKNMEFVADIPEDMKGAVETLSQTGYP